MGGNASKHAAEDIRRQIVETGARMLELPAERIDIEKNRVFDVANTNTGLSWHDVAARCFSENGPLIGRGSYSPPEGLGGNFKGATVGTSPAYSFVACVCEVEVDTETGKVKVVKFTDAHDVGTPINPMAVEGQAEGAIVMMLGETLLEEMLFNDKGEILNPNLHDYLLPTAKDVPEIESSTVGS